MLRPKVIDPVLSAQFRQFHAAMNRYLREVEGDVGELVRKQGRLFGVDLAVKTSPYGKAERGRMKGVKAVSRDVARVFVSPGRVYKDIEASSKEAAGAFYHLVMEREYDRAQRLLDRLGGKFRGLRLGEIDPRVHENRRVEGSVRPGRSALVAKRPKELREYMGKVSLRVAWAKASWAACLRTLGGTRGLPRWITKHMSSPGYLIDDTRGSRPQRMLTFVSNVPYISRLLSVSAVRSSLSFRAKSMLIELNRIAIDRGRRGI